MKHQIVKSDHEWFCLTIYSRFTSKSKRVHGKCGRYVMKCPTDCPTLAELRLLNQSGRNRVLQTTVFVRLRHVLVAHLFSSGICTAIICRGSRHWTTQPCLSLTRAVSTLRKVFGIRLHSTATMVCTSRRGGHCGTGFLCSLLNMADESGIASWEQRGETGSEVKDNTDWRKTALIKRTCFRYQY